MIRFRFAECTLEADLLSTPTARAIDAALPIVGRVFTWGEEVYFPVSVDMAPEPGASAQMIEGDIALWLGGPAIAICFGATPAGPYRLISPGNVFARARGSVAILAGVRAGGTVTVARG